MKVTGTAWVLEKAGAPLVRAERTWVAPDGATALLEVLGCGVCHTDLGFADGGVAPKHALPLVLGHEIVGRVLAVGTKTAEPLVGRRVLAPAVSPCGTCAACRRGRPTSCPKGRMPGNDADGGFSTHVVVPSGDLLALDAEPGRTGRLGAAELEVWEIAPVADAATTAYQALVRAGLRAGDVAVFVGVGGVGGYGAELARCEGAHVVGIDVDARRLAGLGGTLGLAIEARDKDPRAVRDELRAWMKAEGLRDSVVRVFETSGVPAGQSLAFSLLDRGGSLSVVGFTPEKIALRFSNVMALDVDVHGNWGCDPALYGRVVDQVLSGKVNVRSTVERRALDDVNLVLDEMRAHTLAKRAVLVPSGG